MVLLNQQRVLPGIALAALLLLMPHGSLAEILVVTNANSSLTTLSKNQISDVFLGKVVSLPDGSSPTLIDQPDSSPLREEFYMKVMNRTAAQAKTLWAKLFFTGRGEPPLKGNDDPDVKKLVSSIPGAIGYIERSSLDSGLKVLFVVP